MQKRKRRTTATKTELLLMLEIQQTYLSRKYDGCEGTDLERTDLEIYKYWIFPKYGITRRKFDDILNRNVKRELRMLENQAAPEKATVPARSEANEKTPYFCRACPFAAARSFEPGAASGRGD